MLGRHDAYATNNKLNMGSGEVGKTAVVGMRERSGRVKEMPVKSTEKGMLQKVIKDVLREKDNK